MQAVADSIPQLVQGMRSSQAQPEELGAQLALIMASQSFLQVELFTRTQSATVRLFGTHSFVIVFPIVSVLCHRLSARQ